MSHDRGCSCGKEPYEYEDCRRADCDRGAKARGEVVNTEHVNDRTGTKQVGGTHYEQEYQHWDWVHDTYQGYLAGNCSKYVVRWRKKNGIEDLHKARTYLVKLKLNGETRVLTEEQLRNIRLANKRFLITLEREERDFLEELTFWESDNDLVWLVNKLDELIQSAQKAAGGQGG